MAEKEKNIWVQMARYSQLAMTMPLSAFVGYAIGWVLAKHLHQGWLEIAGLLIGLAGGFMELIRAVNRNSNR